MISYNDLIYFNELAETLNFSRASERIGISQPSLSSAIKRLEYFLGTELFIRSKHKVLLTPAGKNLLSHSKKILQLWDSTKAACLAAKNEVQGDISLGCHPSISLYLLPKVLSHLLHQYPKLEIKLKHDLSRKITEQVIDYQIDLGIAVNPIKHPDLIIKKLFHDEVTCWQAKSSLNRGDEEKTIICDPELHQSQWILKKIKKAGMDYKRIISTSSLEMIAHLTAEGVGVGIIPARVMKSLYPNLTPIARSPVFYDDICLIYRSEYRDLKTLQVTAMAIKNYLLK